jgi:uncharacterized protein DUF4259
MGARGVGSFQNDDADDWVATLVEADDLTPITEALAAAASDGAYLELLEAAPALAAAEVVAALKGEPGPDLPEAVGAWVAARGMAGVSAALLASAQRVVAQVRADSELKELWEESDEAAAWRAVVGSLQARLAG